MIWTPELVPMRFAPAARMVSRSSSVRIPPDALTPISGPTVRRISVDIVHRGAVGRESGGCFDEIGAGLFADGASGDLLIVGQQGGFENHFDDRAARVSGVDHGRDVGPDRVEIARAQLPDIQYHVDFPRSRS